MSDIVKFLRGEGTDFKGRKLSYLLGASDIQLERSHDYIQWMFPSDIPSKHSDNAPILTKEQIEILKSDVTVRENVSSCLYRMLVFFADDQWITPRNHNFKRITRILRCLWLLDIKGYYETFQRALDQLYLKYPEAIGEKTYRFWKNANNDEFFK